MSVNPKLSITVGGGGVTGLWQALTLAQRGHAVTLREAASEEATGAASRMAGAMLAPYCEAEIAGHVIRNLGVCGLQLWREAGLGTHWRGTLVLANARDEPDLIRFGQRTEGGHAVRDSELGILEPSLERNISTLNRMSGDVR